MIWSPQRQALLIWGNGSKPQWIMPAESPYAPSCSVFGFVSGCLEGLRDHFLDGLSNPVSYIVF